MNIADFSQKPEGGSIYAKNEVPPFVITTTNTLLAVLTLGNMVVFQGSYAPDFNNQIKIDFAGIYNDYLETLIPTTGVNEIAHSAYRLEFTATFSVLVGEDTPSDSNYVSYYVANAVLKSPMRFEEFFKQNFLTNQPIEKYTNYEAPEWLTYLDPSGDWVLSARFYPKSGGNRDVVVKQDSNPGCYSVDVSYSRIIRMANLLPTQLQGYYDLILSKGGNEKCRQRYIYEERTRREHYFCIVNALGGIDTLICQGDNVLQPEVAHNVGRFGNKYISLDDTDDHRVWSQNTGMMPNGYRNWLHELFSSKQGAVVFDAKSKVYEEIVINESEISIGDFENIASASFSYMLNDTVNVINEASERSRQLSQSVADEAEAFDDLTSGVTLAMSESEGMVVTEETTIAATKLYVEWLGGNAGEIQYMIDGEPAGSISPDVERMPVIINKQLTETIQFSSSDTTYEAIIVKYYTASIQSQANQWERS